MRRLAGIALRALLLAVLGLTLVLGLLIWRLNSHPLSIDWLNPQIAGALTPAASELAVTIGHTQLRLADDRRTVELVGVDVRFKAPDGQQVLVFPEVKISLSVPALLQRGELAVSDVVARAPSLILIRSAEGIIGLRSEATEDPAAPSFNLESFVQRYAMDSNAGDRGLGMLESVRIIGGRVSFYDRVELRALSAEGLDLFMVRRDGFVNGRLNVRINQPSGPGEVQLLAGFDRESERINFDLDLANMVPGELSPLVPANALPPVQRLRGLRLPVHLRVGGSVDFAGHFSPLNLNVSARAGVVDLPDELSRPVLVDNLSARGRFLVEDNALEIERLDLAALGAMLHASGRIGWRGHELSLALDLRGENVDRESLEAFWPPEAARAARSWTFEHVTAARLPHAALTLDIQPGAGRPGVQGLFAFEELETRYLASMSPVTAASGIGTFDSDNLTIDVAGAWSEGLRVHSGKVVLADPDPGGPQPLGLTVRLDIEGAVKDGMTILGQEPLQLTQRLEVGPDDVAGRFKADLDLRLPIKEDLQGEEVQVSAFGTLHDLSLKRLGRAHPDLSMQGGEFKVTVDNDGAKAKGRAAINGVPLDIELDQRFAEPSAEESGRRIRLSGVLDRSSIAALRLPPPQGFGGETRFDAWLTETPGHLWVDLDADLTAVGWKRPGIVWRKKPGDEARLRASVDVRENGRMHVEHFELTSVDLHVKGKLEAAQAETGLAVDELLLSRLQLGQNDLQLELKARDEQGYRLSIEAEHLNLDQIFAKDDSHAFGDNGSGSEGAVAPLNLVIDADDFTLRGLRLKNMKAEAVRRAHGWQSADLVGSLERGGQVSLTLFEDGPVQRFELRSDEAGALISALDLDHRIEGGRLRLRAILRAQKPQIDAEGDLRINNFTIADAPLLARLLTVASFRGISNLLEGEGIRMDLLSLPFALKDNVLEFEKGRLRGSQVGLTVDGKIELKDTNLDLKGTIVPVYTLNRIIGKVPIIGRLLTGEDGIGAFAATYSIKGPPSATEVYVNPLSVLTPGFVRDVIDGWIRGTGEAPNESPSTD